jgi:hypothetical protein
MNIREKLVIASTAITSIAQHRDEEAAVIQAALDKVIETAQGAKLELQASIDAEVAAAVA